jgi:hypothetical protein
MVESSTLRFRPLLFLVFLRFFIALSTVTALVLFLFILDRVNMDEEEVFFEVSKLAAGDSRLILDLISMQ